MLFVDNCMHRKYTLFGFSLIELLVAISIIGILVAIATASYTEARKQTRDKTRQAELKELQLAIEAYRAQYGRYPAMGCGVTSGAVGPGPFSGPWATGGCEEYIVGLVPDFIEALPKDPIYEYETDKGYFYISTGAYYKVVNHISVESLFVTTYDHAFARCPYSCTDTVPGHTFCNTTPGTNPQSNSYAVYSPGTECW